MIPELGHFALILALLVAFAQGILPLVGAHRRDAGLMAIARPAARAQFVLIAFAFGCLAWSFATNDFSVENVAQHSNSQLPLHYRIAATWGSHEGSLLLWVLMLTGWATAVTFRSGNLPSVLLARVLAVMGLVGLGFLLFLLFTSNPFLRLVPAAAVKAANLNPLLQDPGMVIHPPMLSMGYVGSRWRFRLRSPRCSAASSMRRGRAGRGRGPPPRGRFSRIGIALGSWWAYYELGWGGWWFWDPVEKRVVHAMGSSAPRCCIRSRSPKARDVQELDGAARHRRLVVVLGTFLVRSGVLTSVHAFATDPARGVFIPRVPHRRRRIARLYAARAGAVGGGRELRAGLARIAAARQQHPAGGRLRERAARHAVSVVPRRAGSVQGVGRPTVFQLVFRS
jgi:cytochrome c-type biogenesis protein CcmF